MSDSWSVYDNEGRFTAVFQGSEATLVLNLQAGEGYVEGRHDGDMQYFDGNEVADRPSLGLPGRYIIASGADWNLPDMPEGTEVTVTARDGQVEATVTADADGVTLSFVSGAWVVDFAPPFPFMAAQTWVGAKI